MHTPERCRARGNSSGSAQQIPNEALADRAGYPGRRMQTSASTSISPGLPRWPPRWSQDGQRGPKGAQD
eukprot:1822336-Pyramimonas_sp.AAC.1